MKPETTTIVRDTVKSTIPEELFYDKININYFSEFEELTSIFYQIN